MREYTVEITKEEYDTIQTTKTLSAEFIEKYIGQSVVMGYGLYTTKLFEKDGKCFLYYETGSSCD